MEVLTVSQRTLNELSSLETISTEVVTKLCKYFLQAIIRGQVTNEIGIHHRFLFPLFTPLFGGIEAEYEEPLSAITTVLLEAAKVRATVDQIRSFASKTFF
jgi:hypothetical protein